MARAGWILGIIGVIVAAVFLWAGLTGRLDDDEGGGTSVFDLQVGDCVASVPAGDATVVDLDVVDCGVEHEAEVFASGFLNDDRDDSYPGDPAVIREVEAACTDRFEEYVGVPYLQSVFMLYSVRPTSAGWQVSRGEYTCLLLEPGEQLVGSMAGAER